MITDYSFKSTRDRKSEEAIYDECHKKLYYTSLRIVNNPMDAEEIMHDTLLTYFRKGMVFQTARERNSWLTRVCVNLSIDRLRKYKSEIIMLNSKELRAEEVDEELVENYSFKGVTVDQVKKALNNLAAGYRLILSLHLFEGYDYEEIAQITKLKEVSIRSQYIRGKARLIDELKSQYN
ncbi:MAG: RNA polymerase sigma factor [Bacteroidales bacterium]|jgi:RNA polymerase sigma-70 factor (ECF subfamily)